MSRKERERLTVLAGVKRQELTLVQGAEPMGLGYRQTKRVWRRYQTEGDAGLVHRLPGQPSARRKPPTLRAQVLALHEDEPYADCGPTLLSEHLAKEGLVVDHQTLRRWLLAAGLWTVRRRRQKHRQLPGKVLVGWQGEGLEVGTTPALGSAARRLGPSAGGAGGGADGAPWVWNVVADRWGEALQLLDFYHASQYLWALGEALHPQGEAARREWVEAQLHRLRHGKEKTVLREIAALPRRRGEAGKVIRREQNYFVGHAGRMNYQELAQRGWPIASGAVESACRGCQCRRKRPGQFWTRSGLRHLDALEEARDNGHWDELWLTA